MEPPLRAFVALGANLGDRLGALASARASLAALPGCALVASSRVYETRAVGPSAAPFLNAAVELRVSLGPAPLLARLQQIEGAHGRARGERWGARTLDLDLLLVLDRLGAPVQVRTPTLRLPHPRLEGRDFVLRPLADLDPGLLVGGETVAGHLAALPDHARTILRRLPGWGRVGTFRGPGAPC